MKHHKVSRTCYLTAAVKTAPPSTRKIKRSERMVLHQRTTETAAHKHLLGLVIAQSKRDGNYTPEPQPARGSALDKQAALYPMRIDPLVAASVKRDWPRPSREKKPPATLADFHFGSVNTAKY